MIADEHLKSGRTLSDAGREAVPTPSLIFAAGLILVLLLLAAPKHLITLPSIEYLPVHTVMEFLAIMLAAVSCWLLWQSPEVSSRLGKSLLASAMAGSALLDLAHALSYQGMPPLVTPSGPEKAIAFWLAARSLGTLGLVGVAFAPRHIQMKAWQRHLIPGITALLVLAVTWLVLCQQSVLPRTFVPGQGLTPFKVVFEWCLIGGLGLALWRLRAWGALHRSEAHLILSSAAGAALLGELCFATYASVSDVVNLVGHLFKLIAHVLIVRAAFLLAIRQPLEQLADMAEALRTTINPTLICDKDGVIQWVNAAFTQVSGFAPQAVIGKSLLDLSGNATGYDTRADIRQAIQQRQSWRGLTSCRRADGSSFVDDRSISPMRDDAGRLLGFVVVGDDITERERQAIAALDSSMRFQALLDAAPDAIVVVDDQGLVQLVNPQVQTLSGYAQADLIGQHVRVLMPALNSLATADEAVHPLPMAGGDVLVRRKDGSCVYTHLTVGEATVADGHVYIGFLRDITDRIKSQKALEDREARYRTLMDTASDGVWVLDMQGRFVAVNEAYARISQYSLDELLKMNVSDVEALESPAEVRAHIARAMAKGHDNFETIHQRRDGSLWHAEVSANFAPTESGLFFVFVRDITERKAAEESLRRSEERFHLALRASNDGLWDRDLRANTVYYSPRWKSMLGYLEHELEDTHSTLQSLLHPDDALRVQLALDDFIQSPDNNRCELDYRMRHKDGHWVHVLSRAILQRSPQGTPIRLIGTHQDVTTQHRTEAAIRESEEKLRRLFELSPLGIALTDMDGRLLECNQEYQRITGYSTAELSQLTYWNLTPSEYLPNELQQLQDLSQHGRYGPYEKEYQRKDGMRVPVRLNGVKLEVHGLPHIWSIAEDLTETRSMEADRQRLQRQQMQSQKLEALGHLTGGIAHDFNNMLAGIMGLANLSLDRHVADPSSKLAQFLREIVRTSERGRDLVAKMLSYARTEIVEEAAPRNIGPLVLELDQMLSSSIPSGIRLNHHIDKVLPAVRITAVDLHQIVMNLVLNARDAIGEHGHIDVRVSRRRLNQESCINCEDVIDGDFVCLEVCDTGPGIPPDLVSKIFDPFFTTKEVGKGTGLGLASVQGIVHKVGGHIQLDSQPGQTAIRILLPATDLAPALDVAQTARMIASLPTRARQVVWVVDDDTAVLVFLSELLQEHHHVVRAFTDPMEAARAFAGTDAWPDVLITDQTMPGLSGADLARQVLAAQPGFPIILCSGYSDRIDETRAADIGIRHFLRKPFDTIDLLDALRQCMDSEVSKT